MSSNERGKPKGEKRILAPVVAALLMFAAGALAAGVSRPGANRALGRFVVNGARRPAADPTTSGAARSRPVHAQRMSGPCRAGNSAGCASARRHVRASAVRTLHEPDAAADRPHQRGRIATACGAEQYVRQRAAHDRRRPHRASRERRSHSSGAGPSSDVQRQKQHHDSGQRDRLQRSRRTDGAAVVRSCRRCVSARHNEYAGTARDARLGVPDVLHL